MLWTVFCVGFTVIALETVTFQMLSFVADWLLATQVLAVALMGIALGGVASWFIRPNPVVLALFPLSVLSSFFVIAKLHAWPVPMMVLLTLPYVLTSLVISWGFARISAEKVYLYDLIGAGLGALVILLTVPFLREEGTFFGLTLLATVPLFLWRPEEGPVESWVDPTSKALTGAATLLFIAQLVLDPFNLMGFTSPAGPDTYNKVYRNIIQSNGNRRWDVVHSRGSLIERIDIIKRADKEDNGKMYAVYNGRIVDSITRDVAKIGRLDNRMPTRMMKDPVTLLVGPSGQGLCKAVQALGEGDIDAVEINGAIGGLMANELYQSSGRAYEGMDLYIEDVRAFLARTERKYDWITLLNTHRIWSMGHQGPPEYVHTLEAFDEYFDHLTDGGYVLLEERNINEQANLGIVRMIETMKASMRKFGVTDPSKHIAVWELWHSCPKAKWFSGEEGSKCPDRQRFTFIMAKKTPITQAETDHLVQWTTDLAERPSKTDFRGITWRHLPGSIEDNPHQLAQAIRTDDIYSISGVDKHINNMEVVTDNVPYPWNVLRDNKSTKTLLAQTSGLAFIMVLLPTFVGFRIREKQAAADATGAAETTEAADATGAAATAAAAPAPEASGAAGRINGTLAAYFAVLGVGYLVVEIVLMQKFSIFLSSPIYGVIVVLATMLVASGVGGFVSKDWPRTSAVGAMIVAAVGAVLLSLVDPLLMSMLGMGLPFVVRCLITAVMVGAVAFPMGVPFPFAISMAKKHLSDNHAGLMFGINGAAAAIATPLTTLLAAEYGFSQTLWLGAGLYVVCAGLLMTLPATKE